MKIYEILEAPEDDIKPQINVDPTRYSDRRDRFGDTKDWTADELQQVRLAYANNKPLLRYIEMALLMPQIRTMQQAVDYANTELAIRLAKGGDKGDIKPDKQRIGTFTYDTDKSRRRSKTDINRDISAYSKVSGDSDSGAIGAVANAAKSIAGMVGKYAGYGIDKAFNRELGTTQDEFTDFKGDAYDMAIDKGRSASKNIGGKQKF